MRAVLDGLVFPEGPRWRGDRLVFSDVHGRRVLAYTPGTGNLEEVVAFEGTSPSGLGWLPDGTPLIVSMESQQVLRFDRDDLLRVHGDFAGLARYRINDMIVSEAGRAYVSQFERGGKRVPLPLLTVDEHGNVGETGEGLDGANGMALTEDGTTLVVAETWGCRLTSFTVESDGRLTDRRVFAQLGESDNPDGMCLDADGAAWVACPWSARFIRVLEGGELTDVVPLTEPDRKAFACVLGEEDRRTLYLCTAANMGDPAKSVALRAGRIEQIRVDVPGSGRP
jgi:sugar lactone lactonase YvrE